MKKKFLASLLALCMLMSLLPATAFADEAPVDASEVETTEDIASAESGSGDSAVAGDETVIPGEEPVIEVPQTPEVTLPSVGGPSTALPSLGLPLFKIDDLKEQGLIPEDYVSGPTELDNGEDAGETDDMLPDLEGQEPGAVIEGVEIPEEEVVDDNGGIMLMAMLGADFTGIPGETDERDDPVKGTVQGEKDIPFGTDHSHIYAAYMDESAWTEDEVFYYDVRVEEKTATSKDGGMTKYYNVEVVVNGVDEHRSWGGDWDDLPADQKVQGYLAGIALIPTVEGVTAVQRSAIYDVTVPSELDWDHPDAEGRLELDAEAHGHASGYVLQHDAMNYIKEGDDKWINTWVAISWITANGEPATEYYCFTIRLVDPDKDGPINGTVKDEEGNETDQEITDDDVGLGKDWETTHPVVEEVQTPVVPEEDSSDDTPAPNAPTAGGTVAAPETSGDTTTVEVAATTTTTTNENGATVANAEISESSMESAVESALAAAAQTGTNAEVKIDLKTSARAEGVNVSLPADSLKTLAAAQGSTLAITSKVAEVKLDHAALAAVAGQATGKSITIEVAPVAADKLNDAQKAAVGDAKVVDVELFSDGAAISDFGSGSITVSLPYTLAEGQTAEDIVVWIMDDDGTLTPVTARYENGLLIIITTRLGKCVIGTK